MTKKVITTSLVTGAMLTLIGCGGGSGGDTDTGGTNPAAVATTGTGYYIDSAVSGINYTCGSQEGTTGSDGSFTFDVDASCTFTLAGVELRSVDATTLEDGVQIIEQNPRVAQLLQSLDIDGNPDNGITITPEVVAAIEASGFDGVPTDDAEVQELIAVAEAEVETFNGSFVTVEAAAEHVTETVAQVSADEAVFNLPAKYYEVEEEHYDNVLRYEAEVLTMTETAFTHEGYEFEGGAFIPEAESSQGEHTGYILKDGSWVVETMNTTNVTLSADNKVYTIDDTYELTFQSVRDVEGAAEFIEGSQISVTMPAGAERITFKVTILSDVYGIDSPHWSQVTALEDVISTQCGNRYFDDIEREGLDMEGIAFNCDDAGQTSGTLVGVNFNEDHSSHELIPNVGTWQIVTLPNSDIRAIVTDVKPEYQDDGKDDNALFAMKDGQVWRGWSEKSGDTGDFTVYNEVAYDAFEAKLQSLSGGSAAPSPVTPTADLEALLAGKTLYHVEDRGGYLERMVINEDATSITYTVLISSGEDPVGEIVTEAISIEGDKIIFPSGPGEFLQLVGVTDDYILWKEQDATQERSYFDEAKAYAYVATLGSGGDYISITETMLSGKTFYNRDSDGEGESAGYGFGTMTLTATEGTRHEIWYNADDSVRSEDTFSFPIALVDGKIRADVTQFGEGYMWFTLTSQDESVWHLNKEQDPEMNGVDGSETKDEEWLLSKPSDFPTGL